MQRTPSSCVHAVTIHTQLTSFAIALQKDADFGPSERQGSWNLGPRSNHNRFWPTCQQISKGGYKATQFASRCCLHSTPQRVSSGNLCYVPNWQTAILQVDIPCLAIYFVHRGCPPLGRGQNSCLMQHLGRRWIARAHPLAYGAVSTAARGKSVVIDNGHATIV